LDDAVIVVLDAVIAVSRVLLDDADPRSWTDRMRDLEFIFPDIDQTRLQLIIDGLSELAKEGNPTLTHIKEEGYRRFLPRLLGAAQYDRIEVATKADGAVIVIAVRRVLRNVMPIAVALDDCFAILSPEQFNQLPSLSQIGQVGYTLLQVMLKVDSALDRAIDIGLPILAVPPRTDEIRASDLELEQIADQLHDLMEGQSKDILNSLSRRLARKFQGARDVLPTSADGVSQAASSLVELIDRLLREAFDRKFVVSWVEREYSTFTSFLLYEKNGQAQPTKRAEALCFAYAGLSVDQPNSLHELVATALVEARNTLQDIKHSDTGDPEELEQLKRSMAAVEGFVIYSIRVGWLIAGEAALKDLQSGLTS